MRRRPCATGRRGSLIEPTAASHAPHREVEQVWAQLEELVAADLDAPGRADALHTQERLEHNLVRAAADPTTCPTNAQTRPAG
ncbi:hypothetical protein [Streptomyces collinus]|uniref:hypothetical protein n=1 Tax=Streptomyces collinus TaxID=42684 RepID=UPI0029424206|nr:hypothetical protein [Streptomyces collinus]